jgi:hypothetical protein
MPVFYDVKAAIVNESSSHIERLAVKIIRLSGRSNEEFLKTFPIPGNSGNKRVFALLNEDFYAPIKADYLGISFVSYGVANYIKFVSSFKLFPLNNGDLIEFHFDDGSMMEFSFTCPPKNAGITNNNLHIITDKELSFIANNNLKYWKMHNNSDNITIIGGFVNTEVNRQYRSGRVGQKIFRLMVENILRAKEFIKYV